MIDTKQAYCLSGALTLPLIGCSKKALEEGSIPLGIVCGGAAFIAIPFVLQYITPFALQYAQMLGGYFFPPQNPPGGSPDGGGNMSSASTSSAFVPLRLKVPSANTLNKPILRTPTTAPVTPGSQESRVVAEQVDSLVHSRLSTGSSVKLPEVQPLPFSRPSSTQQLTKAFSECSFSPISPPLTIQDILQDGAESEFIIRGKLDESISANGQTPDEVARMLVKERRLSSRLSLGRNRLSVGSAVTEGFYTPQAGSPMSSPMSNMPVGWTESQVQLLKEEVGNTWKNNIVEFSDYILFYLNLSLGSIQFLPGGIGSVRGVSNIHECGSFKVLAPDSYAISALQSICHNKFFIEAVARLKSDKEHLQNLSKDQKDLLKMVKKFPKTENESFLRYLLQETIRLTHKINPGKDFRELGPAAFLGAIFDALNINQLFLYEKEEDTVILPTSVLSVPVRGSSLVDSLSLFFSKYILEGPLPDLISIELATEGEKIAGIDIEEEIDFAPYLSSRPKGQLLYKVAAAICYLEENNHEEGRYVTFIRHAGKWLLCDDDEISEVEKPYLKGAYSFIFEKA